MLKQEIKCPECDKLLAKRLPNAKMIGVYLYCKRCKKEILFNSIECQRAK